MTCGYKLAPGRDAGGTHGQAEVAELGGHGPVGGGLAGVAAGEQPGAGMVGGRVVVAASWRSAQPRRQQLAATPATLPSRFAKCTALNNTQHHSARHSDIIRNQSACRIKTIWLGRLELAPPGRLEVAPPETDMADVGLKWPHLADALSCRPAMPPFSTAARSLATSRRSRWSARSESRTVRP